MSVRPSATGGRKPFAGRGSGAAVVAGLSSPGLSALPLPSSTTPPATAGSSAGTTRMERVPMALAYYPTPWGHRHSSETEKALPVPMDYRNDGKTYTSSGGAATQEWSEAVPYLRECVLSKPTIVYEPLRLGQFNPSVPSSMISNRLGVMGSTARSHSTSFGKGGKSSTEVFPNIYVECEEGPYSTHWNPYNEECYSDVRELERQCNKTSSSVSHGGHTAGPSNGGSPVRQRRLNLPEPTDWDDEVAKAASSWDGGCMIPVSSSAGAMGSGILISPSMRGAPPDSAFSSILSLRGGGGGTPASGGVVWDSTLTASPTNNNNNTDSAVSRRRDVGPREKYQMRSIRRQEASLLTDNAIGSPSIPSHQKGEPQNTLSSASNSHTAGRQHVIPVSHNAGGGEVLVLVGEGGSTPVVVSGSFAAAATATLGSTKPMPAGQTNHNNNHNNNTGTSGSADGLTPGAGSGTEVPSMALALRMRMVQLMRTGRGASAPVSTPSSIGPSTTPSNPHHQPPAVAVSTSSSAAAAKCGSSSAGPPQTKTPRTPVTRGGGGTSLKPGGGLGLPPTVPSAPSSSINNRHPTSPTTTVNPGRKATTDHNNTSPGSQKTDAGPQQNQTNNSTPQHSSLPSSLAATGEPPSSTPCTTLPKRAPSGNSNPIGKASPSPALTTTTTPAATKGTTPALRREEHQTTPADVLRHDANRPIPESKPQEPPPHRSEPNATLKPVTEVPSPPPEELPASTPRRGRGGGEAKTTERSCCLVM